MLASLLTQHAAQLDDETLRTFMMEAEAIVNCRPLTVETIIEVQADIVPTWRIPACRSVLKEKMAQGATPC